MRTPLVSLVLLAVMAFGARADVTFVDGTFSAADWTIPTFLATNGATQTTTQSGIGGNPSAYRKTQHTMPGNSSITVLHIYQAGPYNPATDGPIYAIDYDEDRIQESPPFPGAFITAYPLIEQGGEYYYGPDITFVSTTWLSLVRPGLFASDFTSATNTHPDFSASGGVIRFGYARSNINPGASPVLFRSGIDNWSVHVIAGVVGVAPSIGMEALRVLGPNPFRGAVSFRSSRSVRVHDAAGRLVRTLPQGASRWDGTSDAGRALPAGLYLMSDGFVAQRVIKVN